VSVCRTLIFRNRPSSCKKAPTCDQQDNRQREKNRVSLLPGFYKNRTYSLSLHKLKPNMSLYSGLGGPSAHSDVLTATPDNIDSKRALVEEIKRRGRATVGSKAYPDAEALYGKGIQVLASILANGEDAATKKEIAVLYSNRSLVRLQMGKAAEALEDGDEAVKYDPSYVKAKWRRGQAFTACGNTADALTSFEKALEIEPDNKALKKEVQAAKERKEQEEKLFAEAAAAKANEEGEKDGDAIMKDAAPKSTAAAAAAAAPKKAESKPNNAAASSETTTTADDNSLFTKSDHVRGYKIRSDGKKTSYFDREISEETKQLIGDIAPKKIDPNAVKDGNEFDPKMLVAVEGTSAWNKAGELTITSFV
jgi:tetratricopeptide (TPR) repeat protein